MTATMTKTTGDVTLTFNVVHDKLLSPDCSLSLVPCERCGALEWINPRAVSFLCDACISADEEEANALPRL